MNVSDSVAIDRSDCAATRRRQRLERQARVGLLRNPNSVPKPPARRATLMGKWPNLRTSRRRKSSATADTLQTPEPENAAAITQVEDAVARAQDGTVSAINIDGLMHVVRDLGTNKAVRTPYGSGYRGALDDDATQTVEEARYSILSAQAWMDDSDPTPEPVIDAPDAAPQISRRRNILSRGAVVVVGGVLMAVFVLLVLPVLG